MAFIERLTAPDATERYWISTGYGGLNECIVINSTTGRCIPNCVGYAWGRVYEITGKRPTLSRNNAEDWWAYNDGYERGTVPKLGAVICWRKGAAGNQSDGAGHVAVVERINPDGSILTSNSNYKGTVFYTRAFYPPYFSLGGAYTWQGFIYASGDVANNIPEPAERDTTKDQIEITSAVVNCRIYPYLKARSWGFLKMGIYNIVTDQPVVEADGYSWYCISNDVNGAGDRAWVAYDEDWAVLYPAGGSDIEKDKQIAELKAAITEYETKLKQIHTLSDIEKAPA